MASFASAARSTIDTVINIRDNFIFTVSSMNPPTPGHVGVLIKRMMELAVDMGEQNVYVFFGSRKYDTIDYPLSCEDRETSLNYMITRLKRLDHKLGSVNVIFMYEEGKNNGLLYFGEKINQYFSIAPGKTKQINGFFVAGGDDRLEMIKSLVKKEGVYAEIGVFKGVLSEKLVNILKPKELYLIDLYSKKDG